MSKNFSRVYSLQSDCLCAQLIETLRTIESSRDPFQILHDTMASSDVRTNVSTAGSDATCPAASRRLAAADRPPPVHVTVPDAGSLPSTANAGVENEGLVFYEDHFSLDPLELCKLRFLSGDASVVDVLVEELEGSWQLILREFIHQVHKICMAGTDDTLVWSLIICARLHPIQSFDNTTIPQSASAINVRLVMISSVTLA